MSEYVQCLIAAGWVDAGAVDDEYQQYLQRGKDFPEDWDGTYGQWKGWKDEYEELRTEFNEIEKFLGGSVWGSPPCAEKERAEYLCDEMARFEIWLRV